MSRGTHRMLPLPPPLAEMQGGRVLLPPSQGLQRAWIAAAASVLLHGAALAGILFLLPEVIRSPDREQGVEMVWQDEGVDSAEALPMSGGVPEPPQPDMPPQPEPPQEAAAPPPPPAAPPAPEAPRQMARVAPPPPPPAMAAPPAPPDLPVPVTLPPEAPPRDVPNRDVPPPPAEALPQERPPIAPEAAATEVATNEAPRADQAREPNPQAEALPLPPPPLPLPPVRSAEARPAQPRPAAAPMRPMPGVLPFGPSGQDDGQMQHVGATRVQGQIVPPGLLDGVRNAQPEYPTASRLRGETGVVALVLQVSATGAVIGVEIGRTSGFPQLDEAARKAAQGWRFRPATRDGVPIDGTIRTQVHFRLVQ